MKPSAKRMISSFSAVALLVAALVIFFNFIIPEYREITQARAEVESREVLLENQKKVIAQVKEIIASYEEGGRLQEIVSAALPLNQGISEALLQLGGIAQVNNLTPRAFVVSSAKSAQVTAKNEARKTTSLLRPVEAVTFRVEFSGTYEDFKNYLKSTETNIRIFDVKQITFQPVGKINQNVYSFIVTADAYYQK